MDCSKCGRKNIKYRCISCTTPICNVCSVTCSDKTPCYSEENFLVGKCSECTCQGSRTTQKSSAATARKLYDSDRQTTLLGFFNKTPVPKKSQLINDGNPVTSTVQSQKLSSATPKKLTTSTTPPSKPRNLTVSTADRWKRTNLAQHMASEWLVINADQSGYVTSMNCNVCKSYAEKLKGYKNFSTAWAFTGTENLRLSNVEDHIRGDPHRKAMDLYLKKEKAQSLSERAEFMKAANDAGQQRVSDCLSNMVACDVAKTKVKFEVAYFVAKEQLPLSKFPRLLNLEEKHGVDIGRSYRNDMSCNVFIKYISEDLGDILKEKLTKANFFSVLSDASEDASVIEKEAVFVQHLDKNPPGSDKVKVVSSFLNLADLKTGKAEGVVESIKGSFRNIGITEDILEEKLIGFAADGAAVNSGKKEGVISILKDRMPWVIYVWCVAHRLELAVKDALTGTIFDDVDDVLLRLYYLYENSPKKLRQLRELHKIYSETFEFEEGGVRPKRASGTRWITHKVNALQLFLDKYGVYIQHIQNMCEDKAFKPADRQKFKGWLKKWQQARIPLLSALLIELLAPAKILSLAFQDEEIDIVSSITRIDKAKKQLERLERRTFEELPTVKRLLDKVEFATGQYTYQNVQLHSFETAKDSAQTTKGILLKRMQIALETRLKVSENEHVIMAAQILNTEGWERNTEEGDEDESFADKILEDLSTHFREPLLKAGLSCGLSTLLEQWHSLIDHTKRYLNPTGTHYLRVWHRIFNSPRSVDWNMVLLIAELIFSIPISNAKVERLFSLMKRVKTDSRASLGENTLTNLVRINMEGPSLEEYDPAAAMQLWASGRSRRPQQTKRKKYKKRKCVKKPKVLVDEDTTSEEEEEGVEQNDDEEAMEEDT